MKIIAFCIITFSMLLHPLKMSFSKMYVENDMIKMETRIFLDDLNYHLKQKYRLKTIDFSKKNQNSINALNMYLTENLYIITGKQKKHFTVKTIAVSEDGTVIHIFLESEPFIKPIPSFTIRNTILFDAFKKQKNLLNYDNQKYEFHLSTLEHTFNE